MSLAEPSVWASSALRSCLSCSPSSRRTSVHGGERGAASPSLCLHFACPANVVRAALCCSLKRFIFSFLREQTVTGCHSSINNTGLIFYLHLMTVFIKWSFKNLCLHSFISTKSGNIKLLNNNKNLTKSLKLKFSCTVILVLNRGNYFQQKNSFLQHIFFRASQQRVTQRTPSKPLHKVGSSNCIDIIKVLCHQTRQTIVLCIIVLKKKISSTTAWDTT